MQPRVEAITRRGILVEPCYTAVIMFGTIVVGADLSLGANEVGQASLRALRLAQELAGASGAKVRVMHAARTDAGEGFRILRGGEGRGVAGRRALEEVVAALQKDGVDATLEVADDRADQALLEAAKSADLVIVGKREHFNFNRDHRPLGTVAMRLLRRARCPVWTVGRQADGAPKRVLAATDRSEALGDVVVDTAARLAEQHGAELHVVYACHASVLEALVESEEALAQELETAAAKAQEELASRWPAATVHVGKGAPAQVIVDTYDAIEASLLVLGTVSRSGLADALVGNTAERLFGILDGSMLTLKPPRA